MAPLTRIIAFIALSLTTFMFVLDYSIANVSIPYIAGDLAASVDEGTYVITSFAVGNAIGLALTGRWTRWIGEVKILCWSTALFTFFSWMCGLSFSLLMLVFFRFIQGLAAGPIIPVSQSILIRIGNPIHRVRDLSLWSTIVIGAPVIGPVLGGYISEVYSWPWIFYINIPIGILCVATIWTTLRTYESEKGPIQHDLWGIFLLTIFVTSLQIVLDKGQEWDWLRSPRICFLAAAAIISLPYLLIREIWTKNPLLDLQLFKIPAFLLAIVSIFFCYAMYFGFIVLTPLWLQEFMEYDAIWAGISICSLGVAPLLFTFLTPFLIKRFGNVPILIAGMLSFSLGCFFSAYSTPQIDVIRIAVGRLLFGFGFLGFMVPLVNLSIQDVEPGKIPSATGLFHFIRSQSGAIGTAFFTTLWIRRTYFHHQRIGETLTPFNPLLPPIPDEAALAQLNRAVDVQASILAINEALFLMAWLFAILAMILGIWKWVRVRQKAQATS